MMEWKSRPNLNNRTPNGSRLFRWQPGCQSVRATKWRKSNQSLSVERKVNIGSSFIDWNGQTAVKRLERLPAKRKYPFCYSTLSGKTSLELGRQKRKLLLFRSRIYKGKKKETRRPEVPIIAFSLVTVAERRATPRYCTAVLNSSNSAEHRDCCHRSTALLPQHATE
ncbi:unnamed protein product [Calypogeia fissa]